MDSRMLDEVAAALNRAKRVLFITGAGISADSGLPTYRGVGGLYDDATTEDGFSIEEALSGPMFARRPELVWRYIAQIEAACRGAEPNVAHRVMAGLERSREVVVLTQNVDGLHRAAGSQDVIEIHGTVHTLVCPAGHWRTQVRDYAALSLPPQCPTCERIVRPAVVLFGEMLPEEAIQRLMRALEQPFDLVFTVGTTSGFPYISGPVVEQIRAGRPVVEINPGDTAVSSLVTWRLRTGAADAMDGLRSRLGAL